MLTDLPPPPKPKRSIRELTKLLPKPRFARFRLSDCRFERGLNCRYLNRGPMLSAYFVNIFLASVQCFASKTHS
jgi:hypothetical protein